MGRAAEAMISGWLAVLTVVGGAGAAGALLLGTRPSRELAEAASAEPQAGRGRPQPPPADAPAEAHLAHSAELIEFLQRRIARSTESLHGLTRVAAQIEAGAYSGADAELVLKRRAALEAAVERDRAELRRVEARRDELGRTLGREPGATTSRGESGS